MDEKQQIAEVWFSRSVMVNGQGRERNWMKFICNLLTRGWVWDGDRDRDILFSSTSKFLQQSQLQHVYFLQFSCSWPIFRFQPVRQFKFKSVIHAYMFKYLTTKIQSVLFNRLTDFFIALYKLVALSCLPRFWLKFVFVPHNIQHSFLILQCSSVINLPSLIFQLDP